MLGFLVLFRGASKKEITSSLGSFLFIVDRFSFLAVAYWYVFTVTFYPALLDYHSLY